MVKMNILIVAYWHDPRFKKKPGGLIRMFELADNLTDLGHHVTMVLPKLGFPETQTRARVVAIPFWDLPMLRPLSFHLILSITLLYMCLTKTDFIYVRQMNSFLPLLIAKFYGRQSYFEIPNDPYIGYSLINKTKRWAVKLIDTICMHLADKIIVLSDWSKTRLHVLGRVPISKILVFPSGTDTELFHPIRKEDACRKLKLSPASLYVGFIGSFFAYQGIDILIEAAPLVLEKIPDTRFLLVGDGPMRIAWEKKVQEKDVQSRFIFTGHVPYQEVPNYIGAMDVCVAPHHQETNQASPVKLFDYMASGRPIVASDIDVVREIVKDSGCAILPEPGDAKSFAQGILFLLENHEVKQQMAEKARKYAVMYYDRKTLTKSLFDDHVMQ
ncbi:MAG: glycosyltransferase family 4 protein [Bacteroidales bacterium]|nr:glycosyltransferase family 4 protein [Bacteroidales bacterium]